MRPSIPIGWRLRLLRENFTQQRKRQPIGLHMATAPSLLLAQRPGTLSPTVYATHPSMTTVMFPPPAQNIFVFKLNFIYSAH